MFGFFKKKKTALDVLVDAVYGKNPPKQSANLNVSVSLAYEKLLSEQIPLEKVSQLAKQLNASGIPYNTYDLALCTALNFFKDIEHKEKLSNVQLLARVSLLQWVTEGKCNPKIAEIFENTLYDVFKDFDQSVDEDVEPLIKGFPEKFQAQSLINVIERKSFTDRGYFFDIHQDIESYYVNNQQASANILMPAFYARRFCFAGMYAQGLAIKDNFDEVDQSFFQTMAQIGFLISKQEQIEFQEESFEHALKWINHYYCKVEKHTSGLLVVAAKNGLSLRDALSDAVETWETDNFSENLNLQNLSPEFCTLFYTIGGLLPNDGYNELAKKSYNFFLERGEMFGLFGKKKKSEITLPIFSEGMRMEEAEVDILFILKNNKVLYINDKCDNLFTLDRDNHEKLNGRVVNMVFIGQSDKNVIEVFVAFDEDDSYTMFTLRANLEKRLNYVCQAIFKYFAEKNIVNILSFTETYSTQHIYAFKMYRMSERYFMVNNSQTQAYLIDENGIDRDGVDAIKARFWG